ADKQGCDECFYMWVVLVSPCGNINCTKPHLIRSESDRLYFFYNNFLHHIALADLINDFQSFIYSSKTSMVSIEVAGVVAAVANEKLRSPGIPSGMCHGNYSTV